MKKATLILLILGLVLLSVIVYGCEKNSATPSGNPYAGAQVATFAGTSQLVTSMPTKTANPDSSILLEDDFSNPFSGWEVSSSKYGQTGYDQGSYYVEAAIKNEYYWGVAGIDASDIQIDVDASVVQTVSDGNDGFGVDCRLQENADGYGFRISSDGYISIAKYVDTKGQTLQDWIQNDAVYTDGRSNHLTAICQGNLLRFQVNGIEVAQVVDDTYASGDISLSAIVFEDGTIRVNFDNLVVTSLDIP